MSMDRGQSAGKVRHENFEYINGQKRNKTVHQARSLSFTNCQDEFQQNSVLTKTPESPFDADIEKYHLTFPFIFKGEDTLIN